MKKIENRKSKIENVRAFTLIELLLVIAIIGVIAGFTLVVLKPVKAAQYKKVATAEMNHLETALENYKAKYGAYPPGNQNALGVYASPLDRSQFSQLYYELAGTTKNNTSFVTELMISFELKPERKFWATVPSSAPPLVQLTKPPTP